MSFMIALLCLSMNIYHEARGEGYDGMAMVALVTMNRADHDPDKVCEVVTKPYQFSWYNSINRAKTDKQKLERIKRMLPKDNESFIASLNVARQALTGTISTRLTKLVGRADHYFNPRLANPAWKNKLRRVASIGNHDLYTSRQRRRG